MRKLSTRTLPGHHPGGYIFKNILYGTRTGVAYPSLVIVDKHGKYHWDDQRGAVVIFCKMGESSQTRALNNGLFENTRFQYIALKDTMTKPNII